MGERAISAVAERLNRLERENRRLRRVGAAGLLGLSAVVLTAQTAPAYVSRVVEAERFVVRHWRLDRDAGEVRAVGLVEAARVDGITAA